MLCDSCGEEVDECEREWTIRRGFLDTLIVHLAVHFVLLRHTYLANTSQNHMAEVSKLRNNAS